MHGTLFALTLATALGCTVIGGVFYGFSVLVMRSLAAVPPAEGIRAMQAVNRNAETPRFLSVFMGTSLASLVLGVWSAVSYDSDYSGYVLAGSAVYFFGAFLLTIGYHVPRNIGLDKARAGTPEAEAFWSRYLREWTRMNHVRGLAAIIAGGLLIAGLAVA